MAAEMAAAVELIKRGLRTKDLGPRATATGEPDSEGGGADLSTGLAAVGLLERKAKANVRAEGGDDGVEGELRRARNGARVLRESEDELLLAMKDLTASALERKAARKPGRGSQGVAADRDEDKVLLEAMNGLLARRRPQKGRGSAAADQADELDDGVEPLADAVLALMSQDHAIHKGRGSVAAKRDADDAALIDGVADRVAKWQAKPKADEQELLAMLAEWIDTDEPRRQRARASGTARDEDDVALIDSLSDLVHSQKYETLAAAVGRLTAQHRAKLESKGSAKRDTDDAALIDGVVDRLGKWQAKPTPKSEGELLAMLAEWIDTDEPRRQRARASGTARDEDDVALIDSLSGLVAERRKKAARAGAKRPGMGSVAVRADSTGAIAATEESTLSAMAALIEARKGRGSAPAQADENEDIIDAMMSLVAEQHRIMAMRTAEDDYDHG
jgi:hypothetical protein